TATTLQLMAGEPVSTMGGRELHGQSLLPLLEEDASWYKPVHYAEYHGDWYGHYSARMVTDGDWKLVWNLGDLCELYDLNDDPNEFTNRFYDPACASVRDRYLATLFEEAKRFGDAQLNLWNPAVEEWLPRETFGSLEGVG
ncbi:MAG TPA: sulfatase/phosphatase domain-containing protein, partial [Thermomicrobiales bacterium]|nr:sulfatase/phosphatase domain-containing protein [Thermomicrobiales bacterium]